MTGMSPWLGRLILLLALITIDHASPALAVTLVIGAAGAATAIFLYRGSYLPRFVMDILDRLSNKTSLQQAYEKRSQSLVTIDADDLAARISGNVQRAVLARELGGEVEVLIAANPCFGLDFAAVAQIHAEIMAARNRGAAVLLVSEDLDELLELSDRLVVMFHGEFVHEARASEANLTEIGRHMAGH